MHNDLNFWREGKEVANGRTYKIKKKKKKKRGRKKKSLFATLMCYLEILLSLL